MAGYTRCGSVINEKSTLLWTNANPSSAFSAQTISLDLSGYTDILIKVKSVTSETSVQWDILEDIENNTKQALVVYSTAQNVFGTRLCTISSTGIAFSTGYFSNNTTWTTVCIPLEIRGLKHSVI